MKPPLPRILSDVPRTLHAQIEVVKAIQKLLMPEEGEPIKHDGQGRAAEAFRNAAELAKAGFRADQPRWRKGSGRRSGRWSGGAGSLITDQAYRRLRGGHHYVPKEIFEKLFRKNQLRSETRKVFDEAVTGPLPKGLHKNDRPHREYTEAVDGLWHRFLTKHEIRPEYMTPEQARKFVHEVLNSNDPRISLFNGRFRR